MSARRSKLRSLTAKPFSILAVSVALTSIAWAGSLPVTLPKLPIGLPGSGSGGPGGPGGPGGSGGGSGPGGAGPTLSGYAGATGGVDASGISEAHDLERESNDRFGDPLSADLLGSDRVKAHLRYYGQSSSTGTTQAVGINLTIAQ